MIVGRCLASRKWREAWRLKGVGVGFAGGKGGIWRLTYSCARLLSSGSSSRGAAETVAREAFKVRTKTRCSLRVGGFEARKARSA